MKFNKEQPTNNYLSNSKTALAELTTQDNLINSNSNSINFNGLTVKDAIEEHNQTILNLSEDHQQRLDAINQTYQEMVKPFLANKNRLIKLLRKAHKQADAEILNLPQQINQCDQDITNAHKMRDEEINALEDQYQRNIEPLKQNIQQQIKQIKQNRI